LLILLALALFVLEAKFVSHGVLAVGGIAAMVLGALMLVQAPIPEMRMKLNVILPVTLAFAAITVFLLSRIIQALRRKVTTGTEEMLGLVGMVTSELAPDGQISIRGEYWRARAATRIPPGTQVRVTGIEGLTLLVEPFSGSLAAGNPIQPVKRSAP
jgi:membrane-bound serine protease (ClpP class)